MRAIKVVDLETTGFHEGAEVIEYGAVELWHFSEHRESWGWPNGGFFQQDNFRPLNGIPPESRAVHHISLEELALEPTWAEGKADAIESRDTHPGMETPALVAIAAHSAEFERRWLEDAWPGTEWICTYKAALRAWPDAPGHSVFVLLYWLQDQGRLGSLALAMKHQHKMAHRAGPDAWATSWILAALLEEHDLETLIQWTREPKIIVRVPFGEHRGKRWHEVDTGLLDWILRRDFDDDVKAAARREIDRRMEEREREEQAGRLL